MESLKSIASMLGKWLRPAPRPLALESSALSKLPSELILNIACFLPLQSASSFSLCCRPIYFILGTQYLKALETSHWDRYEFLMLLERELPDHIVCYHCKKLHAISQARRHIYSTNIRYVDRSLQLPCIGETLSAQLAIHPYFSFNVFQMTMKRYRQGLDYSELLNLLSYETKTSPHYETESSLRFGFVEQCSWLFRVVGGSLLFRKQIIFMLPPTQPITIPWELESCICPHLLPLWMLYFLEQKDSLDRGRRQWRGLWREPGETRDDVNLVEMTHCDYCLTEFRMDLKQFGERGAAIFITTWQDLGQGLSLLDPTWQSHVTLPRGQPVAFERGSICTSFEQKEHFRFEFDGISTIQDRKELFRLRPF